MKIVPLESMANHTREIVLAHGCFDGLHPGHVRLLTWAKALLPGGSLVATITSDRYFPSKGIGRPLYSQEIRAEMLAALQSVDFVAIVDEPTAVLAIDTCRPIIYAKGAEGNGVIAEESMATVKWGGHVVYMPKILDKNGMAYSSTRILSGAYFKRPRGVGEGDIGVE